MSKGKLRLLLILLVLVFFSLYYGLLIGLSNASAVEKELTRTVEALTGGKLQSEGFKLSYFPTLQSEFRNVSLSVQEPEEILLKAERVKFKFGFFGFFFKRADLSSIELQDAFLHTGMPAGFSFKSIDISHLKLKARLLHSFKRIQLQWEGDFEGIKRSFAGKAILGVQDASKRDWNLVSVNGDVQLKELPLSLLQGPLFSHRSILIKDGSISGQYHLHKENQDPWIYANGRARLTNLIYETQVNEERATAPTINTDFNLEAGWQPMRREIDIKSSLLTLPFGNVQFSGKMTGGKKEIRDARLTVSDLLLEQLPPYYLPFREAIPFNLGFSGKSNLEMSIEGMWDKLMFHGNWDLGTAFLSYGNIFSKPKDVPCDLAFDLLLKNNQSLGGDFSLRLNDAGFKGTLVNFDVLSGTGDLNILSNKFLLERWMPLLPFFAGYQLSGEIKFLANFSGHLIEHPQEVKSMVNVILEKGQISKDQDALKGLYFAMDYSPISLEIKQGQVMAGDYPLFFSATVFDPKTQPHAKINLRSQRADIAKLITSLDQIGSKIFPNEAAHAVAKIKPAVLSIFSPGESLDALQVDIEAKGNEITLQQLKGEVYDGTFQMSGKVTPGNPEKLYEGQAEINHLSLARYFEGHSKTQPLITGNLFLKGGFQGKSLDAQAWLTDLKSKGVISITNGEFSSFSILKTIAGISGLSMLAGGDAETTPFDDFQAGFIIENGKLVTEKANLISSEIKASGDGEMSLEGILNYRLNAYISMAAVRDALGNLLGDASNQDDYLGPIPMLLSGDWQQPELKTDPSGIAEFTENLTKKKTQKVLRSFLPEDVLFGRPNKS